jgi:glycosyltransferase involved in cell wall biosynthesis
VTFTNLYPSRVRPAHGVFVRERMRRVVERLGCGFEVVCPLPRVPRLLPRRAIDRLLDTVADEERVDGVRVRHPRYLHLPGLSEAAQARRMAEGARAAVEDACRQRPVVLDAHYVYPDGVAALRLARELDLPCFVTARGTDLNVLGARPKVRRQLRELASGAAGLFAVSEPLRRRFVEVAGVPDEAVVLARNGVDLELFHPGDQAAARRHFGLPEEVALVVGVGRLIEEKGFHLIARALRSLPAAVHLALVGTGPERGRLEALAPPGRLHLLGARPPAEVAELLRAADLLVLPSVREGWPNVVTEALASGVPVVATAVGAVPEMLAVPYVGAMVRGGDHRALAREVERFLSAPRDPQRIRAFAQRFAWDGPIQILADAFTAAFAGATPEP